MTEPLCAGCNLMETRAVQHQGRHYCASCPELPEQKRRAPPKADPVRDGLGALLKKVGTP